MRVAELEAAINEAVVTEKKDSDNVQIGSDIKINFDGEEMSYKIVAPGEADILKNKISYQSPLGQRLLGQKSGIEFNFQVSNRIVKVKILDIK
jgi:transcription elongation factor GreA